MLNGLVSWLFGKVVGVFLCLLISVLETIAFVLFWVSIYLLLFTAASTSSWDDPGALVGVDRRHRTVDEVRATWTSPPARCVVMLDSCYFGWYIRSKSAGGSRAASIPPPLPAA
jgi:hypothetical protein